MRVVVLREVGDDPGDQSLVVGVPAVLGRVQCGVALHHPAQVAGERLAQHHRAGPGALRAEEVPDGPHGLRQPGPVGRGHGVEQGPDRLPGPLVQHSGGLPARHGEPDPPPAWVAVGGAAVDQPRVLELVEDPAQIPRVQAEQGAQVGRVQVRDLGEFVQHTGFGEGVRGVEVAAVVEGAEDAGVEAVEGADVLDSHDRPGCLT